MKRLKNAEDKVLGEEPIFTEPITDPNDIRFADIYNWYNYHYKIADGKEWIKTYMTGKYTPEETEAFYKSPDHLTPFYVCVHARLYNRGMAIPRDKLDRHILKILDQDKLIAPEQDVVEPNVQSYIKEKIGETIGIIENIIDDFYSKNYKFYEPNVYLLLQLRDIKSSQSKTILDFYTPQCRKRLMLRMEL
jgi:hypothetical protein